MSGKFITAFVFLVAFFSGMFVVAFYPDRVNTFKAVMEALFPWFGIMTTVVGIGRATKNVATLKYTNNGNNTDNTKNK